MSQYEPCVFNDSLKGDPEWIIVQRRKVETNDVFTKSKWEDYRNGFGKDIPGSEAYWIGLEKLFELTKEGGMQLLITLRFDKAAKAVAWYVYDGFSIESELFQFRVKPGSLNSAKSHRASNVANPLHDYSSVNNAPFSTIDKDNDVNTKHCAAHHQGGWWFNWGVHNRRNMKEACTLLCPNCHDVIYPFNAADVVKETLMAIRKKN